jgi:hypothetical protein
MIDVLITRIGSEFMPKLRNGWAVAVFVFSLSSFRPLQTATALSGTGQESQVGRWAYTATPATLCVADKIWIQYNLNAAVGTVAYGNRVAATYSWSQAPLLPGSFYNLYGQNAFGSIPQVPAGCDHTKTVLQSWAINYFHVLKWNGNAWAHCQGIPQTYNSNVDWQFAVTLAHTATTSVLCGTGYYYVQGTAWVWDGTAYRGSAYYNQSSVINVTDPNLRQGPPPPLPAIRDGDQLPVLDSKGEPLLDSSGIPLSVIVDLTPPQKVPNRPVFVNRPVERASADGVETLTLLPMTDTEKASYYSNARVRAGS